MPVRGSAYATPNRIASFSRRRRRATAAFAGYSCQPDGRVSTELAWNADLKNPLT
jgi:hypothetical protein